jgi:Uncharacterised nucleotidyltransferase
MAIAEFSLPEAIPFSAEILKKEWPFLCACVAPSPDLDRINAFLANGLDWEAVLGLAEEHGVQGMLARTLQQSGHSNVPPEVRETLRERMRLQHLFSLGLTVELFRILDDFSKSGIEGIAVKGPVLSELAYEDPAARKFGDLDFLLRHRDIVTAMQRMQAMGFASDIPAQALQTGKIPGEYVFRRAGTRRLVELHTEKTFRHYPSPMRIEDMLQRKREVMLDDKRVPALSLEDELVFDCVHGGKDFWERLVWVADIAAILTKYPAIDWIQLSRAAQEVGATKMLFVGVQLAASVFGLRLPDTGVEAVKRDSGIAALSAKIQEWLPYAGQRPPRMLEHASYRMEMAGGGIAGLKYFLRLALSPTEDDWERGGTGGSGLWDAVRRPFRLLRKYGSSE